MSEELENKEFDRSIENKFSEHKTSVPDYLWSSIDSKAASLETSSLRKRLAWYRWIIVSLVVLLGGIFLFYQFDDEFTNKNLIDEVAYNKELTTIEEQSIEEESKSVTESESTITNDEVSVLEVKEENVPLVEHMEESLTTDLKLSESISDDSFTGDNPEEVKAYNPIKNEVKPISNSDIIIRESNDFEDEVEVLGKDEETLIREVIIANGIESEQEETTLNGEDTNQNSSAEDGGEQTNVAEPVIATTENETSQDISYKKESNVRENDDKIIEEIIQSEEATEKHASVINESESINMDSITVSETISDIPVATPVAEVKALSKITLALFVIPNLSYRGFEASNSAHEIYQSNDETKLRFSFGSNVGYNISDKVTVKLGVSYHQSKTAIELNDKRPKELPIIMDPTNNSITIYSSLGTVVTNDLGNFSFAGDDEDDEDLDDEDDFASLNFKEEQEFLLLDIPLTVGCTIGKGKLKLLLEGGIVTSILTKAKSKIEIGNTSSPDDLVSIEDYHQTKKIVLGGTVGVGFKYNISRRFSIIGLPSYNTSFIDMNKDNASKMKPNSMNFSLGLQFQF